MINFALAFLSTIMIASIVFADEDQNTLLAVINKVVCP